MTTTIPQSSSRTPGLVAINALGPSGEYCTPNREIITDTAGVAVAECTIVPPPDCDPHHRPHSAGCVLLSTALREAALAKTAEIFANSVIGGLDFDQYVELASWVSGLPIGVTRAGARSVADAVTAAFDSVLPA